jgi:hypothetical protein
VDKDGRCAEPITLTLCVTGAAALAGSAYDYFMTDRREQAYAEVQPASLVGSVLTEGYAFGQSAANTLTGGYFDAARTETVVQHTMENVLPVDAAQRAYGESTRKDGDLIQGALYTAKALGQTAGLGLTLAGAKSPTIAEPKSGVVVESPREVGSVVPNKTTTGSDVPYNSRNVRNDLVDIHGVENVSSTTIPPINAKNVKLAGQRHRVTGIVFDNKGFPIFNDVAAFDTRLPIEPFRNASYTDQMRMATNNLAAAIQRGEVNPSAFSANQLGQIQSGSKTVDGFTWHHHQDTGRMQLVPRDIHKRTGHLGWEAMSDDK